MKVKKIIIILLLLILLTSCGIDTDKTPERTYTGVEIRYFEPAVQYSFRAFMDSTETEFAKYFFEFGIDEKDREACIEVTEKVLSAQVSESNIPEIYVFSKDTYDHKYISDNKLYCSLQNWNSVEYITDVLIACYGQWAHYGTAFGYANYLAKSDGQGSNIEGKFSIPETLDILDLNFLCFDEDFVSPSDIIIAKEVACNFADLIIKQSGEKAIRQMLSSYDKTLAALWKYYMDNGISFVPSPIHYAYGGRSCDYIVYSGYGTFYVKKDWIDMHVGYNPLITEGFLHSDYAGTKAFFETNFKQMQQYRDLFRLGNYNNDLDVVFTNPINVSKSSFYQAENHRIYLYNVDSLMHEYIHALTNPTPSMSMWQVEGFARYFSYYYDFYGIAFLNQDYNNCSDTPELKYVHEYLANINRPIDMAKDYLELENIVVYSRSLTDPNANYVSGSSFVQYLVKQYGEEAVINSIYGYCSSLPETYAESVKAWKEYINTNYTSYSKYK
ncbi:MAG: hypothetical protein J6D45_08615 [Clostridia bacterium]|nr:hypothetical protein [Clostridia bacterium]